MLDLLVQFNIWAWLIIAAIVATGILIPMLFSGVVGIVCLIFVLINWLYGLVTGKKK